MFKGRSVFRVAAILPILAGLLITGTGFTQTPLDPDINPVDSSSPRDLSLHTAGYLRLIPYKSDELGERTPLVLVHGIGGDSKYFHWEHFLAHTDTNLAFQKRYKIYLVHYNSARSVADISRDLRETLKTFIHQNGDRPIRVLAYSEGGLLTRNAVQDPFIDSHTQQVITIATPFHGSPLANPKWVEQQVRADSPLAPLRMTYRLAYWVARKQHPSFENDFHWDNFDQAISAEDFKKNYGADGELKAYALGSKSNFITYGSFFGDEVDADDKLLQSELGLAQPLNEEHPKIKNLFGRNIFFSVVRRSMAQLPNAVTHHKKTAPALPPVSAELAASAKNSAYAHFMVPETRQTALPAIASVGVYTGRATVHNPETMQGGGNNLVPMQAYNDGISPISSTLWLGRFTPGFDNLKNPVDQAWAALKSLKGKQVARLFQGVDHRNWMDGETRHDATQIKDLLNPDEPPKTVFDWILHDLMG